MKYMQIFTKYYEKLDSTIREKCEIDDDLDLSLELFPFLVVTGSCSFMGLPSDVLRSEANKFNEEIINPILNIVSGSEKEFSDRMDLYVSVVQGNQLRGEWCMGFIPPHLSSDLVMRCVIVLGDIVLNPDCAVDYFSNSNNKTTINTMRVFSVFAEEIPNIMNEYRNELLQKAIESSGKRKKQEENRTSTEKSKQPFWERWIWDNDGIKAYIVIAIAAVILFIVLGSLSSNKKAKAPASTPTPTISSTYSSTKPEKTIDIEMYSPVPAPNNGQVIISPSYESICPFEVSVQGDNAYYVYLKYMSASVRSQDSRGGPNVPAYSAVGDVAFYIAPNSTVEIDVPVGIYKLYYACGKTWYGQEYLFGEKTMFSTSDELLEFYTDYTSVYGNTLELWAQYDGNFETENINASQFPG